MTIIWIVSVLNYPHLPPHFEFPAVIRRLTQQPEDWIVKCAAVIWQNLFRMQVFTKAAPEAAAWSCLGCILKGSISTHSCIGHPHTPINSMSSCNATPKQSWTDAQKVVALLPGLYCKRPRTKIHLMSPELFICQLLERLRVEDWALKPFGQRIQKEAIRVAGALGRPPTISISGQKIIQSAQCAWQLSWVTLLANYVKFLPLACIPMAPLKPNILIQLSLLLRHMHTWYRMR